MSLVISITCALLATLLQQWARRYLKVTQPRYGPHKRARIRAFFFEGVDKFLLPWTVEALPTLLHVSLFLFFAGLVVFLCNVNLTIFKLVLSWVCVCTTLYGCFTIVPIFRHDSPYHTPLSLPTWYIVSGISFVTFRVLHWFSLFMSLCYLCLCFPCLCLSFELEERSFIGEVNERLRSLAKSYRKLLMRGMRKTVEETALNSPSEIDTRAFLWTFDGSDEDHELERFFSGLPGFRSSKVVDDPLPSLTEEQKQKLIEALIGLLDRTFSSDLLPEQVKSRRAVICAKAINPAEISEPWFRWILVRILSEDQYGPVQSAKIADFVRGWGDGKGVETTALIQAIVSSVVARAQVHDDHWFAIASDELGVPETDLRVYATDGDSLSLAILIYATRQQFIHVGKWHWPTRAFSKVLKAASKFNIRDTSPELQHEFCTLWNEIVLKAQNDNSKEISGYVLSPIQNLYTDLHQDTNSALTRFLPAPGDVYHGIIFDEPEPSSFPLCNVPGHHPDSTPRIHDGSASTTFARTDLHDNAAALAPAPLASSDASSLPVPAPRHAEECLTDVPPLDNDIYVPGSFHPAHHTAIENVLIPATSHAPVTARVIQGVVDTSAGTMHPSTPEPSAPTPPPASVASTSPPGVVALQHIADHRTPSDILDVPLSPSLTPVLDNMLPTDPQSLLDFPMTGSDHASSPESHSLPLAPAAPGPSRPQPSFAPDLGAAAKGESSAKAALHKERDALDPPSAIRENIMAAPNLPLQSPSLSSVTDVAIAGPSRRSLGAEHTGDHPSHPLHGQYDIV